MALKHLMRCQRAEADMGKLALAEAGFFRRTHITVAGILGTLILVTAPLAFLVFMVFSPLPNTILSHS